MTLDTDSYRQQIAFRINQALSDDLSPLAQRHTAEIAIALGRALCDEIDRLRAAHADLCSAWEKIEADFLPAVEHNYNEEDEAEFIAPMRKAINEITPNA